MTQSTTNKNITNQSKKLSVQISLTGLSFFISEGSSEKNQFFSTSFSETILPEQLLEEIKKQLSLQAITDYDEVTLLYTIPLSTLVPLPFFDENKKSEYLKFNSKILATDYIAHDTLTDLDIAVVYIPYVNVNNYFVSICGSVTYYHTHSTILSYLQKNHLASNETKVYGYVQSDQVDIYVLKDSKVVLANSFTYKTTADFMYYVLFVFEQVGVAPSEIETVFFGEIEETDDLFEMAYQFIKNVHILTPTQWNLALENPASIIHHLV